MENFLLRTENSAQGTNSKPNPLVKKTLDILFKEHIKGINTKIKLVDLGCGKLRHLKIYAPYTKSILLVDTEHQINRKQKFGGITTTMQDYIRSINIGVETKLIPINKFSKQKHKVDIILNVAVMDAVPPKIRYTLISSASKNLKTNGHFIVIVPRNDSSVLINCTEENSYQDGYLIKKKGTKYITFYANFRNPHGLYKMIVSHGFTLKRDISNFRQICWIFTKK